MRHFCALVVAGVCVVSACGPSPSDAGPPNDAGAPDDDAGHIGDAGTPDDAGSVDDAGTPADAGVPRSPCPVADGDACRAVDVADVSSPSSTTGVEMPGATFTLDDGDVLAVFPRYTTSQALSSRARTGTGPLLPMADPTPLALSAASDVTGATVDGSHVGLLFGRAGAADPLGLIAFAIDDTGTMGTPWSVAVTGTTVTPYWPQLAPLDGGRLALAFVESSADALRRSFVGVSDDGGHTFAMRAGPTGDVAKKGNLAHVGASSSGALFVTWQEADDGWLFTSYVQISHDDGETYDAPITVAPESDNVHDAYVVARLDAGVDLYYLRDGGVGAFNVFRRPLSDDGVLGAEQRVTAIGLGHVEKPQARRLPDGRLTLAFARRLSGSDYRASYVILEGDAASL